jgi:alkaline phosphatase
MKTYAFLFLCFLLHFKAIAQKSQYTVANAHSHNDYEQKIPFYAAYQAGFGSIEADIFLKDGALLVAHNQQELILHRTLDSLYLIPLLHFVKQNGGFAYADTTRKLQMMIDIKSESQSTLQQLIEVLQQYPELINNKSVKWVISGNRPAAEQFVTYPSFISFDGYLDWDYSEQALSKIAMLSGNLSEHTLWNGKSNLPANEQKQLEKLVTKAHTLNKPIRFWGAPDMANAWYQLMNLQVDYINTDHISELAAFFTRLQKAVYNTTDTHEVYMPTYTTDGSNRIPKNVILLIGDGCGLAEWYTGYTANKSKLSVFNIQHTGFSKTSSFDSYITDSAPGSTAFASGKKTNNRFVGVDHNGKRIDLIPEIIVRNKMLSGIVSCGDIADATPADFYAHRSGRDSVAAILEDLAVSPVQFVMGAGNSYLSSKMELLQQHGFAVVDSLQKAPASGKYIVADSIAGLSVLNGRGNWLSAAFDTAVAKLSSSQNGFFLMLEAAQIDHGGHDNNLPYIATEVMDFDKVIGKALQFADINRETLVIVTADHETGGLSLLDGDYQKGYLSGSFSTNDHTAIPVPVYAYGPQSQLFTGVYENTAIFYKIMTALGVPIAK